MKTHRSSTVIHNIHVLPVWALLLWFVPSAVNLSSVEQNLSQRNYRAALDQLNRISSHEARWHALASRAYDGLNDPERAVQEAEEALKLDPGNPAYHLQLAQIFLSRNTPKAALEILTEAEALFPDTFLIRLGKGLAERELQLYAGAEKSFQWCLEKQPASAVAFDALATVYLHQVRFSELRVLATDFLKQNPTDYRGYYFLAAARDGEQIPAQETKQLLASALQRNPSFAAGHALMGKVLLRERSIGAAVMSLKRAVELRPDLVQAHLNLARAFRAAGNENEAAREFELVRQLKAKEQEPAPSLIYHRGSR